MNRPSRQRPLARFSVERLEDRAVPAFVATMAAGAATFTGDANSDDLIISVDPTNGLLRHNRYGIDPGYSSPYDFDSTNGAGTVDTLPAGVGTQITVVGGGSDNLTVDDSGDTSQMTYVVQNGGIQLGSSGTIINFNSGLNKVALIGGQSNNTFDVFGTGGANEIDLYGGAGNDTFDVGSQLGTLDAVQTPLHIDGQGGTDQIVLDDALNPITHAYQVDPGDVNRNGMSQISFNEGDTEGLQLDGGQQGDVFRVSGTVIKTDIDGMGGDDTLKLDNAANLSGGTFDGGNGSNTIDYSAWTTGVSVNLTSSSATGVGKLANVENATGGAGDDTFVGDQNNNRFDGGAGNNTYKFDADGFQGSDTVSDEGSGTLDFSATAAKSVHVDLNNPLPQVVNSNMQLTITPGSKITGVVGGAQADLILGNGLNDYLYGGAGDDTIVAGSGTDVINGGDGNDTIMWNNGAGSGTIDGGSGADRVIVTGSVTGGDNFTANVVNGRTQISRNNLTPFNLDIGTAEQVTINGLGVNDTFNVLAVLTGTKLALNGGAANNYYAIGSNGAAGNGTTGAVQGEIDITGRATDTVTVDDSADAVGRQLTITPTEVGAGSGDDYFGPGGKIELEGIKKLIATMGINADDVKVTPGLQLGLNGGGTTYGAFGQYATGGVIDTLEVDTSGVTGATVGTPTPGVEGQFTFASGEAPITFDKFEQVTPGATVSGTVYKDLNANNVQDPGEPGLAGVTVWLVGPDGHQDVKTVTDANGNYTFGNLPPGTYLVQQQVPTSWMPVAPPPAAVTVTGADATAGATLDVATIPDKPQVHLIAVGSGPGGAPLVNVYNFDGSLRFSFDAFDPSFTGGVSVATGDVNGDGVDDIIVGAGAGGGPQVKVFDGVTGQEFQSFYAYDPSFAGGVNVAAGDVTGDGRADIITGAGAGGGPHVKVFNAVDDSQVKSFYAFDPNFSGGVTVAAGDFNKDGRADIVVGAGAGGLPQVKVFDGPSLTVLGSLLAYAPNFKGGVFVAAGDINGDGVADIITGPGQGGGPNVKAWDGTNGKVLLNFMAYDSTFGGGVRVAAKDLNADGVAEVVTSQGPGATPSKVQALDPVTKQPVVTAFTPFDATDLTGATIG